MHNIILHTIADTSDAFTYVKLYIKKDDGITDIKVLRSKYENDAMQDQYVRLVPAQYVPYDLIIGYASKIIYSSYE